MTTPLPARVELVDELVEARAGRPSTSVVPRPLASRRSAPVELAQRREPGDVSGHQLDRRRAGSAASCSGAPASAAACRSANASAVGSSPGSRQQRR